MEPLAKVIRQHPKIKGINIAIICHKMNLFAYDVILTLTDIEDSLQTTLQVLDMFIKVSYYKINSSKSLILGFSVDPLHKIECPIQVSIRMERCIYPLEFPRNSSKETYFPTFEG